MKRILVLVFISLNIGVIYSQVSGAVGTSLFNNFGIGRNFYGFDLGVEYDSSEDESYWGRIAIYPSIKNRSMDSVFLAPKDINNSNLQVAYNTSRTSFMQVSGGSRYYMGDGFDTGIGVYGGYKFSLILGTVKNRLGEYDETQYQAPPQFAEKSQVLYLTVGLNGGAKYSIPNVGTIFLDASADYAILGQPSNNGYVSSEYINSGLFFSLNLGIRRSLSF